MNENFLIFDFFMLVKICNFFVKHELKGVLQYTGNKLNPPPSPDRYREPRNAVKHGDRHLGNVPSQTRIDIATKSNCMVGIF
jgi:hypothetical protein